MMESTNLVTELISILIRKHELFFPETEDEELHHMRQQLGGDSNLIDFNSESPRMQRPQPILDYQPDHEEDTAEDPRSQIQELENELELQQQQIKDLQIKLESACKVQEMLTIRLQDELRARVSAEDRLVKLQSAMEEFCVKYGSWEPPQT